MNQLHSAAQREQLRASAQELLTGADSLLDAAEREARDLTSAEHTKFRSLVERANFLSRKASGEAPEPAEQRSRLFRAIQYMVQARGSHVMAERAAREAHDAEVSLVLRAATAAADSATPAWAGALIAPVMASEVVPLLRPRAAIFGLVPNPLALDGEVVHPRITTGSTSAFLAEGQPLPLKQNVFDTFSVKPYKAGSMVFASAELMRRGGALAEAALITPLVDDIASGVDAVFLSGSASSAAAPAGLFHGDNAVAAIAATAGANAQAAATDLANLFAAGAKMVRPVLLINGATAAKATQLAGAGDFPLLAQLPTGRVLNAEVLYAGNLATTTVALVDAADLIVAGMDDLRIDVSVNAVLHADTAPNADVLAPASGGVNLYQRDLVAVAIKAPVTWRSRRTAAVQRVESCSWA